MFACCNSVILKVNQRFLRVLEKIPLPIPNYNFYQSVSVVKIPVYMIYIIMTKKLPHAEYIRIILKCIHETHREKEKKKNISMGLSCLVMSRLLHLLRVTRLSQLPMET